MKKQNYKKREEKDVIDKILELGSIPFMQLKGDEKLLFLVDDDKWCLDDTCRWLDVFKRVFPNVDFCVFLKSMFTNVREITDREYSMLNNILKRCDNSNEVNNNENI